MATRGEVAAFLHIFKGCVMVGRLVVGSRRKNRQGLIDLGLSAQQRREELLTLEPDDYVAGPKPDHTDGEKEVWEFGKTVEGVDVYIKLRVTEDRRDKKMHHALVWSFHLAERPLVYPLKGGGS